MTNLWIISIRLLLFRQVIYALDLNTENSERRGKPEELNLQNHEVTMQQDSKNMFEGDMVLNKEQFDSLFGDINKRLRRKRTGQHLRWRKRRTVIKDAFHKWPELPISVIINSESGADASVIKQAMQQWESQTCVRFKELPFVENDQPYLEFKMGEGCSSNVGRSLSTNRHKISINAECSSAGMIAHLIGHSLGLFHEHARYDRDKYVNILEERIIDGYENQFSKRSNEVMETYSVPYDYGSLMHFNQTHFSQDGFNTLEPADSNYRHTVGQRTAVTFSDAKKINFAYCKDVCQTKLKCKYDGYADPKNCYRCRCAEVFGGDSCEQVRKTASRICGINLDLKCSEKKQKIELSGSGECHYVIKSVNQAFVELDVTEFEFKKHIPCEHEYLEVRYGKHLSVTGARFCVSKPNRIISATNTMVISYRGSATSRVSLTFRCGISFLASTDLEDSDMSSFSNVDIQISRNLPIEGQDRKIRTKNASYVSTQTIIKKMEETETQAQTLSRPKKEYVKIVIPELLVDEYFPSKSDVPSGYNIDIEDQWTSWTVCTANCGGCGTQLRNRTRPYLTLQSRYCNTRMCENSGCCLPFTYVYKGTCLRPFSVDSSDRNCEKLKPQRPTPTISTSCIALPSGGCHLVKDEEEEQLFIAGISSSIDSGNIYVTDNNNYNSNNSNNNNVNKSSNNKQHTTRLPLNLPEQQEALKKQINDAQRKFARDERNRTHHHWQEEAGSGEELARSAEELKDEGSGEDNVTIDAISQNNSYSYNESLRL